MRIGQTIIDDTFAEAFGMRFTRLIITAHDEYWLSAGLAELTGYGTSIIGCDAEAAVERKLGKGTPDGRMGASVMLFAFSTDALGKATVNRVGQCLMTCPTVAVFNGLTDGEKTIPLGKHLRFFGDGFQKSKVVGDRRYWRVPTMEGEFLVEESAGLAKGIAGGNLILQSAELAPALKAARSAVTALADVPNVITPFPGGVVRSGSKVGSRYEGLRASTADAFCPTLKGRVTTKLHEAANVALEIVINGVSEHDVGQAMATAIRAAARPELLQISAGNYGGNLGPYHFELHKLLS